MKPDRYIKYGEPQVADFIHLFHGRSFCVLKIETWGTQIKTEKILADMFYDAGTPYK